MQVESGQRDTDQGFCQCQGPVLIIERAILEDSPSGNGKIDLISILEKKVLEYHKSFFSNNGRFICLAPAISCGRGRTAGS